MPRRRRRDPEHDSLLRLRDLERTKDYDAAIDLLREIEARLRAKLPRT